MDLQINLPAGLLKSVRFLASPNFNERPPNTTIDLLVLHNISLPPGEFGSNNVDELFTNTLDINSNPAFASLDGLQVSAHIFIRRDGTLTQYVPFSKRAWHAGVSSFQGRDNCNDYSIGIELEGTDTLAYTENQYQVVTNLASVIMQSYPAITPQRIVGHADIAPERKTDPGVAFDWQYFFQLLKENNH